MLTEDLIHYRRQVETELTGNILPFYLNHAVDPQYGGFYGYIAADLTVQPNAPKALIQNSRILWAFAHAYRVLSRPEYLALAERACHYLLDYFWDADNGGLYWLLDHQGRPVEPIKMGYGQTFGVYALSEYHLATGHQENLDKAIALFHLIERHL